MTKNTMYQFLGTKFKEYIHLKRFKDTVQYNLDYTNETDSLEQFYDDFLKNHLSNRKSLDKIFFENILYGQLKNVFSFQLAANPSLDAQNFQISMQKLIETLNKNKVSQTVYEQMSDEGFYLMESLNITKIGSKFLAGFDFTKTPDNKIETARFLIVQVVPLKDRSTPGYFIGGVDVNYTENTCLIMIKNITSKINKKYEDTSETHDEPIDTLTNFLNYIKDLLFPKLGITYINDTKKDRQAMFNMCKELDTSLLHDLRDEVDRRVKIEQDGTIPIELAKTTILTNLFPKSITLSQTELLNFSNRLDALVLATYINKMVEDDELVSLAKLKGLVGFPTKISFKSDTSAKGATGTSGKECPIASSVMFHSLYTDLQSALELPQWSVSWFNDHGHADITDTEVVPTTIISTNTYLQITFRNTSKFLNKELIYHVIKTINRYRSE
ncbi:hypothetical protein MKX99_21755 [Bacillus sp. FSL R9-9863]|uniref:hypothetical protein n=1 Tax=Bacillus sp. FSL R9-9863 TaxID=2921693 RepID=UPI0030FB4B01